MKHSCCTPLCWPLPPAAQPGAGHSHGCGCSKGARHIDMGAGRVNLNSSLTRNCVLWLQIAAQLDVNAAMKAILRGAASSPAHDHFLNAYETGLRVTLFVIVACSTSKRRTPA